MSKNPDKRSAGLDDVCKPFRIAAGVDPFQSLADWYGGNLSRLAAALNR
jgi:hypothetical protein